MYGYTGVMGQMVSNVGSKHGFVGLTLFFFFLNETGGWSELSRSHDNDIPLDLQS